MKVLFIIPAYNEEKTLGKVIEDIESQDLEFESDILVVDDHSSDSTSEVAERKGVKVLRHPLNLGGGGSLKTGFKYAERNDYDIVLTIDADGQHRPDDVNRVLEPVLSGRADMSVGSRFKGEAKYDVPKIRYMGIKFYSKLTSYLTGQEITDVTSGYRAINRGLFKEFADNFPYRFYAIEPTTWAGRRGFQIEEVPVVMSSREEGNSHLNLKRLFLYPLSHVYAIIRAL